MLGKSGNNHEMYIFGRCNGTWQGRSELVYLAMVSTWSISSRQRQQEDSPKAPSRLRDPASAEHLLAGQLLSILYQSFLSSLLLRNYSTHATTAISGHSTFFVVFADVSHIT